MKYPFWNIGRTGILEDFIPLLLIIIPPPLPLESPKSFVLSLQLILHDGITCYLGLSSNCLADVHTLIAVNLQGELDGTILGLRYPAVRQLPDQQRLRLELRLRNEFEGAVVQLLCNAETMESGHAAHHGIIGCKQKIMSIIIISHATLLSMLAVHQLLDVIKNLIHNLSEFKSKESEKRSATLPPEIPSLTPPG